MKLDFDDLLIKPCRVTTIDSRSEVMPYYRNRKLPLFTAPMDTVINDSNLHVFKDEFNICLPRKNDNTVNYEHFTSYGFDEFKRIFDTLIIPEGKKVYALLDIANGHMQKVLSYTHKYKTKYGEQLVLMVGNVASPETFSNLQEAGADYIRIGIGNGNGCLTTVQTGVGYPMASLIQECKEVRDNNLKRFSRIANSKIVADGGFKKYSDIIKALALGADYVMLGSMLNLMYESCGEMVDANNLPIEQNQQTLERFKNGEKFYKLFRGMSTKDVQKSWGNDSLRTSEGIVTQREVQYTYDTWVDNFKDYLSSAMSYTGYKHVEDFIGSPQIIEISKNAFDRFNK